MPAQCRFSQSLERRAILRGQAWQGVGSSLHPIRRLKSQGAEVTGDDRTTQHRPAQIHRIARAPGARVDADKTVSADDRRPDRLIIHGW